MGENKTREFHDSVVKARKVASLEEFRVGFKYILPGPLGDCKRMVTVIRGKQARTSIEGMPSFSGYVFQEKDGWYDRDVITSTRSGRLDS